MTKQGVVKIGQTPGAANGGVSVDIDKFGEPVASPREKRACHIQQLPPVKTTRIPQPR